MISRYNPQIKLTLGVERQVWIVGLFFTVILAVTESIYFGGGVFSFVSELISQHDPTLLVIGIVYIVASIYITFLYFTVALASSWRFKPLYIAFFGLVVFVEYGYSNALGRFTNFYDIVSAFSATSDQTIDSIHAYFSLTALVPLASFTALCVAVTNRTKLFGASRLLMVAIAFPTFFAHFYYVNNLLFDRTFVSSSFSSFWQTTVDFAMVNPFGRLYAAKREQVDPPKPEHATPSDNIIFVFDESVRADHLSLNGYARSTTPYLESLAAEHLLLNWGIAVSGSTISHPSYNAMITGATPDMIDKKSFAEINQMPTLFQYAKAMGYKTTLIDGQMKEYWGGNPDDLNYIDTFISMKDLGGPGYVESWEKQKIVAGQGADQNGIKQWEIDGKIAGIVNHIFTGSTGNFVFIYKRGAHFPYDRNYPDSAAVWRPFYHFKEQFEIPPTDQHEAIVNSYDNAIKENIDDFFLKLSPDYKNLPNRTVIIYTSDHGESLFVNGKAGHGGVTREEAMVPLFVIGLKDREPDVGFRAAHANVFTALLDLMGYPKEKRKYDYQISLFDGRSEMPANRRYNPPPGKAYNFDQ